MQKNKIQPDNNKVLIVGGGIGGIRCALDLAEAGRDVVLIDKAFSIGGLMTQLDRTFPTNNCDLCTLSSQLSEGSRQLHIELLTMTQLVNVQGKAGDFKVNLVQEPRYIDLDKCTACGSCFEKYPEFVRFSPGLDHRAPTCMRYPQATPYAYSIDMDNCQDVDGLVHVCPADAIIPKDSKKEIQLKIGAIVLALGGEVFDPGKLDHYIYESCPDVVTSLEYERILSASGPTGGKLVRPSDGKPPQKIAWIQCVGSRGLQKGAASYCSGACCMFALKEAMVTREHFQDTIEATVFYMDMRTCGKDYELYYLRARNEFDINFVHSRPHSIVRNKNTGELTITYTPYDSSVFQKEAFDMVVLSTGFFMANDMVAFARMLGIELNDHNFVKTSGFNPVATSREGIYVCGLVESPKDIPETMVQASAAACMASRDLVSVEESIHNSNGFPPERDVSHDEPRIGVFICDCGYNIGGVINIDDLADYTKTLSSVAWVEIAGHGCSRKSLEHIKDVIITKKINRVVIGGCSPRTHEAKFQDTLREAGLNKYLLEMANIRDQDTWVHLNQPELAAQKARDLIKMAVAAVIHSRPLTDHILPINRDALVVGGGVTGMNAALNLADQGFKVYLVEKYPQLGGMTKDIRKSIEGEDIQTYMADLIRKTLNHDLIYVMTSAIIVDHSGVPGLFKTGMQVGKQMFYRQVNHGVTILATGALANRPGEYLLDEHKAVKTQLEMDGFIEDHPEKIKAYKNVVMIQCVGSRSDSNPNCSRVCCQAAAKNALRILDINPDARVIVLYRDMRTYGFYEDYYLMARQRGVIFVNYRTDNPPKVSPAGDNQVEVTFKDRILGRDISVLADSLCLSTGFINDDEGSEDLAMVFHLQRTSDGFFLEDHVKLRPVDLPVPGFFVAGTAHAPKTIRESIAQAQAVVARAQTILNSDKINLGASVARVDSSRCTACLICVRACPFGIPFINADGYSEIDPSKCHGCGVCASECPAKAIQLMQFEDDQIIAKLNGLLERKVA